MPSIREVAAQQQWKVPMIQILMEKQPETVYRLLRQFDLQLKVLDSGNIRVFPIKSDD